MSKEETGIPKKLWETKYRQIAEERDKKDGIPSSDNSLMDDKPVVTGSVLEDLVKRRSDSTNHRLL